MTEAQARKYFNREARWYSASECEVLFPNKRDIMVANSMMALWERFWAGVQARAVPAQVEKGA